MAERRPKLKFQFADFWISMNSIPGSKMTKGTKEGWAEMGQVAYNMLSYAMGYNYIIIPNKPVSVFPLNNQSTNVFFSWLIWSLSAMSEGMKWFQSRQKLVLGTSAMSMTPLDGHHMQYLSLYLGFMAIFASRRPLGPLGHMVFMATWAVAGHEILHFDSG